MKKSTFNIIIATFTVVLSICFTSCKPDPDPDPTPQKVMLPAEIVFDNNHDGTMKGLVVKITYDDKNRIATLYRLYPSDDVPYHSVIGNFEYDSSGQLTKITFKSEGGYETTQTTHYTYSDNFVTVTHAYSDSDSILSNQAKYELKDGRMIREFLYDNGTFQEFRTFSFDLSGNIIKISDQESSGTNYKLISYENKKGVFSGINKPDWLLWNFWGLHLGYHSVNNPAKIEFQSDHGNYTIVYEYLIYNSNDYPTKIKVDDLAEIEIKYIETK